jgi:hypothetical protein
LQSCRITYDLPGLDGECGLLVDLIDENSVTAAVLLQQVQFVYLPRVSVCCCSFCLLLLLFLQSCRITYDLPGPDGDSGVLVDLIDDEDLEMMWEEFDSYAVSVVDMLLAVLHSC